MRNLEWAGAGFGLTFVAFYFGRGSPLSRLFIIACIACEWYWLLLMLGDVLWNGHTPLLR